MKKSVILLLMGLVPLLFAENTSDGLEVGMHAPGWIFTDADGKDFTMDNWAGKIIQINYVDPDESEMNEAFNDAVKKVIEVDSLISRDKFEGFGIGDCAATWKPNFAIRFIAARKAEKFDTTILFDYDAKLRKSWGLKKDSYNVIILDKDRVCRAIERGKITDEKQKALIQLIIDLQNKM
jgi:predicted transcriptional regulator